MSALSVIPTEPTDPRALRPRRPLRPVRTLPLHRVLTSDERWKRRVAQAFGEAAVRYHDHADVQREVADALARRIAALPLPRRPRVLEIGCGTGLLTLALRQHLDVSDWVATDISEGMIASCRQRLAPDPRYRFVCLDGEHPALRGPFDLICSSMAMQWFIALERSLPRLRALLRPGGHLACATLVEGTFHQWREAHRRIGLPAAMLDYPTVQRLSALWPDQGYARIDTQTINRRYATPREFLAGLKRLGANTPGLGGPQPTTGTLRRLLRSMNDASGFEISYKLAYAAFTRRAVTPGRLL